MSWNGRRIFRVAALCALFFLHSALIGIAAVWMLKYEAGTLQFAMDAIVLFTILSFSAFKYNRRNAGPSRIPNLMVFFIIFVPSLVGAIGLAARSASKNGKGLCKDPASNQPGNCTEASAAIALTWLSVVIAGAGLVVSWIDRTPRMASSGSPYGGRESEKGPELPKESKSTFYSSRTYVPGPTSSYVPRPRDPYDPPRRKRSTRSQPHQAPPQRVPSNRTPAAPLPPLPSFNALELETDSVAAGRIDRRRKNRARPDQSPQKDLPELPPPRRRPPKDPQQAEARRIRHISPTDLYAQMGG